MDSMVSSHMLLCININSKGALFLVFAFALSLFIIRPTSNDRIFSQPSRVGSIVSLGVCVVCALSIALHFLLNFRLIIKYCFRVCYFPSYVRLLDHKNNHHILNFKLIIKYCFLNYFLLLCGF